VIEDANLQNLCPLAGKMDLPELLSIKGLAGCVKARAVNHRLYSP
jgi:hypothetical protein